jgi:molybdopterin oxidoreductase, molybdopterin binding subunit
VSRRTLLKAGAAAAAPAAGLASALFPSEAQLKELEAQGWTRHPMACCMCGAYCGLIAMRKEGEPVSEKTVRIFPNPDHPQRGYCGRAASTMWIWNHPLRLRKPLKRTGQRGEGKFVEVTWDEALSDIAEKLKAVVAKHGEASVCATSHSFSSFGKWLTAPLGSPNSIGHSATCNSAGISAREWVFGKSFNGAGKLEPDYANLRYLILIGRSMGSSMGALHTLNAARARGAKVIAVDPRMPDIAYGDAHWVPIRPGQDGAFALGMLNVLITEKLADFEFLSRHTNAARRHAPHAVRRQSGGLGDALRRARHQNEFRGLAGPGARRKGRGPGLCRVARNQGQPHL